jgi:hypothetical protein
MFETEHLKVSIDSRRELGVCPFRFWRHGASSQHRGRRQTRPTGAARARIVRTADKTGNTPGNNPPTMGWFFSAKSLILLAGDLDSN